MGLDGVPVDVLPEPSKEELAEHLDLAVMLAGMGYHEAAEHSLLRLFYRYAMPDGTVYDLIVSTYQRLGDEERAAAWAAKKNVMLCLDPPPTRTEEQP